MAVVTTPSAAGVAGDDFETDSSAETTRTEGNKEFQLVDESWFYNSVLLSKSRQMFLDRIEAELETRLGEIESVTPLTSAQRKAIEAASLGDTERFLTKIEPLRQSFLIHNKAGRNDVAARDFFDQGFWPEAFQFQRQVRRGLFSSRSLFNRAVRLNLTRDQFTRLEELEAERRAFRWKANVPRAIISIEEWQPMTQLQRQQIAAVLEENVPAFVPIQSNEILTVMRGVLRSSIGDGQPGFSPGQFEELKNYLNRYIDVRFSGEMEGEDDDHITD